MTHYARLGTSERPGSWHVVVSMTRGGMWKLRCGRFAPVTAQTSEVLPGDERSCESCLRWSRMDADRTPPEDEAFEQ